MAGFIVPPFSIIFSSTLSSTASLSLKVIDPSVKSEDSAADLICVLNSLARPNKASLSSEVRSVALPIAVLTFTTATFTSSTISSNFVKSAASSFNTAFSAIDAISIISVGSVKSITAAEELVSISLELPVSTTFSTSDPKAIENASSASTPAPSIADCSAVTVVIT